MAASVWTHLSLGSNVGDRGGNLRRAVAELEAWPELHGLTVSSVYETAHVGDGPRQRDYWNLCLRAEVELTAQEILARAQALERGAGRRPDSHGQPRSLDIDVLGHRGEVVDSSSLQLPHPRISERRFVLEPLLEIDAAFVIPEGRAIAAQLRHPSVQRQRLRRLAALERCVDEAGEVIR